MKEIGKIADGLGSWLTFEHRAGRSGLFCESYLANPLAQLLQTRYPGRVLSEVHHPVLAPRVKGPGRKPRVDFAVRGDDEAYEVAVELKWVSGSRSLPRDIVRDAIRLDLLLPGYSKDAVLILAGRVRHLRALFESPYFQAGTGTGAGRPLGIDGKERNCIYFLYRLTPQTRSFFLRALMPFRGLDVSRVIQLNRWGPYPRLSSTDQYQVLAWRLLQQSRPFEVDNYDALSGEAAGLPE